LLIYISNVIVVIKIFDACFKKSNWTFDYRDNIAI